MTLGEQISQLRKQQKLSQEELAAAMQVSRQAVSKWENDISNPDTENLLHLAKIFKVDVNTLIDSQTNYEKEAVLPPLEHTINQRKTILLLSILLVVALCSTFLLGTLWAIEQFRKDELPAISVSENRWDSVKLYKYVALKQVEVPLTEKEQMTLASLVWNYRYTEKRTEDTEIIYGGIHAELVLKKKDVIYSWTFKPQGISCTIKLTDGYTLNYVYEPDHQVFTYLNTFMDKE